MTIKRIDGLLDVHLPDPPMPGPNQHIAIRVRKTKEGYPARTFNEQFPFGMITNRPPPDMVFNWGGEQWDFIQDMLVTNFKLLKMFKENTDNEYQNNRIREYRMQLSVERAWAQWVKDNLALDIKQRLKDKRTDNLDMYVKYYVRHRKRGQERQHLFMKLVREGIFRRTEDRMHWEWKIKQNPRDNRLRWSADMNFFMEGGIEKLYENKDYWIDLTHKIKTNPNRDDMKWPADLTRREVRIRKILETELIFRVLDKQAAEEYKAFLEARKASQDALKDHHKILYAYMVHYENTLTDTRPGKADYGIKGLMEMRLGKVRNKRSV